jgi:hypothetical protein
MNHCHTPYWGAVGHLTQTARGPCQGQMPARHSRAAAGLTTIDAGIAGSTGFHQAAAGHTRRSVAHAIREP